MQLGRRSRTESQPGGYGAVLVHPRNAPRSAAGIGWPPITGWEILLPQGLEMLKQPAKLRGLVERFVSVQQPPSPFDYGDSFARGRA
jgi:hypothetical protein